MPRPCFHSSHYEKFLASGEVKCIDDEIPFEIPESWCWVRLRHILNIGSARRVHEKDWRSSGIPFYRAREIGKLAEYGHVDNDLFIEQELYDEFSQSGVPLSGDLMVTAVGTLGKVYVVHDNEVFYYKDGSVLCLGNTFNLNSNFLKLAIESPFFIAQYQNESQGTTVATLTMVRMNEYLLPIPPIAEQQRIISMIEDIMPSTNRYEKSQEALDKLNAEIFEKLKKSVLQEAIQGKLVPQDPNDEPASVLIERIHEEKQRLLKEGKLKKKDIADSFIFKGDDNKYYEQIGKKVVDISEDIPFEIPESWSWSRLSMLVNMRIGKTPARGDSSFWDNGVHAWISISDMSQGDIIMSSKEKISDFAASSVMGVKSPAGSLLMSFKLTVGKTAILGIDAYHNEAIVTISTMCDENYYTRNYLAAILPLLTNYGNTKDAIKGKTLNSQSLNALLIPIPPHEEQRRIIENIRYLFSKL